MKQVQLLVHSALPTLLDNATNRIKELVCPHQITPCFCNICIAISENRSPFMLCIPQKNSYTRQDIQPIHDATELARSADTPLAIVLPHPEHLLHAAANSLLKLLEEPPAHYYFFLLSQNINNVISTIVSRAEVIYLEQRNDHVGLAHPLITHLENICLAQIVKPTISSCEEQLSKTAPDPQLCLQLIDTFIKEHHHKLTERHVTIFTHALAHPPAVGSGKLFWRNLCMQLLYQA